MSLPFFERLDELIASTNLRTKVYVGGRFIREDGVPPGTRRVYLMSGEAKVSVAKIKTMTMI